MKKLSILAWALLPFLTTSCNLYGGLSSPGNDEQYLSAARACLDLADYDCAVKNYAALSDNYKDIKLSEGSLTQLAQGQIFSISDLIRSLGSSLGDASSFAFLAASLATRGITDGAHRTTIINAYNADSGINDTKLKAFSQFIATLALFNEILANAVGPDGVLTASDIVDSAHVDSCKASSGGTLGQCPAPSGTTFTYDTNDHTAITSSASAWAGAATLQKLAAAASAASQNFTDFSGSTSNSGIYTVINGLKNVPGTESPARYLLLQSLGL